MIFTKEESSENIIATIKHEDVVDTYKCKIAACSNPVCRCSDVDIILEPISKDGKNISNLLPKKVKLDVLKESLAYRKDTVISQVEKVLPLSL